MNSQNPILSVSNLHKRYDSTYNVNPINLAIEKIFNLEKISSRNLKYEALDYFALKNINLNIFPGQIIGIIGRNGSGKSTFLKLLAGLISPSIGKISVKCSTSSILELGIGFNNELTGEENAYRFGRYNLLSRTKARKNIDFIKNFAELDDFFQQPVKYYSSGMFARLAFACAVSLKADLLIIDEILSVGDIIFQQKCFDYLNKEFLKNPLKSVIYVGHDMETCKKLCSHGLVLDKGNCIYYGNIENAVSEYYSLITKVASKISLNNSNLPEVLNDETNDFENEFDDQWVDLFSSTFFNPKFNRIGERQFSEIKSIAIKGWPLDGEFEGNESLEFIISVKAKRKFIPSIGMGIWSVDGIQVVGTNSNLCKLDFKEMDCGEIRNFSIKTKLNLNAGAFFFNFGVDYKNENEFIFDDVMRSAMVIQVKYQERFVGLTRSEILITEN